MLTHRSAVFVLSTFKFSTWAKAAQRVWIENVEKRLGVTTVMIEAMRTVKMLGLSDKMSKIISHFRAVEIDSSSKYRKILIGIIFFCESNDQLHQPYLTPRDA